MLRNYKNDLTNEIGTSLRGGRFNGDGVTIHVGARHHTGRRDGRIGEQWASFSC